MLASEIDDMTAEGTKVFLWADCCQSDRWAELNQYTHHRDHLISYVHTDEAYTGSYGVEFHEFFLQISDFGNRKIESIFSYIREMFLIWSLVDENDDMEKWDNLIGRFYV